jgi:Porin subfamily.
MKLKSLFLGSVAAAGLSTAGFAADLGVLTSLDVCDALGLSGLTISSDTNCLQISGKVDYRLRYGDYRAGLVAASTFDGDVDPIGPDENAFGDELDWDSRVRAYLTVVGTADTDFGPASAIITLRQVDEWRVRNEGPAVEGGDHTDGVHVQEAYVRVGDATVLMAGKRKVGKDGSIANIDDDQPYSFLFMSDKIDGGGVLIDADDRRFGGHAIQIVSDLGNGVSVGLGLENIDTQDGSVENQDLDFVRLGEAGTLIGVVSYAGETVSAHLTGIAYGVLDGDVDSFAVHAGATGTFDIFKVRAAIGYDDDFKYLGYSLLHALVSAEATFDMFTVALSGEVANFDDQTDYTIGGKIGATVVDGVSINLDAAWFRDDVNVYTGGETDTVRIRLGAEAAVTETITLTAGIGTYFGDGVMGNGGTDIDENLIFGDVGVAWAPGGGFTSAAKLEFNDEGGYRGEFTAAKSFE